jgi:hypothetical protein
LQARHKLLQLQWESYAPSGGGAAPAGGGN